MSSRLKGDNNISKNETHISKAIVCIKNQVDKYLKEKERDAYVLSISIIFVKVVRKAPRVMLHYINNNKKPRITGSYVRT